MSRRGPNKNHGRIGLSWLSSLGSRLGLRIPSGVSSTAWRVAGRCSSELGCARTAGPTAGSSFSSFDEAWRQCSANTPLNQWGPETSKAVSKRKKDMHKRNASVSCEALLESMYRLGVSVSTLAIMAAEPENTCGFQSVTAAVFSALGADANPQPRNQTENASSQTRQSPKR